MHNTDGYNTFKYNIAENKIICGGGGLILSTTRVNTMSSSVCYLRDRTPCILTVFDNMKLITNCN